MNETTEMLLFMLTGVFISIAAGTATVIMLLNKIGEVRERLTAIEVRNELADRWTAKIGHSSHDPYGWDSLIDRYLDRNYEMTLDEWREWLRRCEVVIHDETKPKEDRIIAIQLAAVCWHKLMMPPPQRIDIEEKANDMEDLIQITKKSK
jgi:hypothetical protein